MYLQYVIQFAISENEIDIYATGLEELVYGKIYLDCTLICIVFTNIFAATRRYSHTTLRPCVDTAT